MVVGIIYIKQYQVKHMQDDEIQINSLVDYRLSLEDIYDQEKKKVIITRQYDRTLFISSDLQSCFSFRFITTYNIHILKR